MSRASESLCQVTLFEPKDAAGSAYVSDAIDLGKFNSFTAYLTFGAITGNSVLTVNADTTSALATALTTPIAFKYKVTAGDFKAASADVMGAVTAVALTGLTLTAATYDHTTVAIEIDPDTLTGGARWVTFNVSAVANPLNIAGIGIGVPRYPAAVQTTVLV